MRAPPPALPDATGVLIAGGRAVRMGGVPKGLLRLDGEALAARTLRLFRATFREVLVVANDPLAWHGLGVRVVPDLLPGRGAPGGLHAALAHAPTPWIFAAGCDMPFVSAAGISLLAARRGGRRAVVPRWRGRLEPLHAFWSRDCLPRLEPLLHAGEPSLREIAAAVEAEILEEPAWAAVDPGGRAFVNVNTPEEAAALGLAVPAPPTGVERA